MGTPGICKVSMLATSPSDIDVNGFDAPDSARPLLVRLALLKGFELTRNGDEIRISAGAQRLLAFLALSRRTVHRSLVAGALWCDVTDRRAAGNLRSAVWRLRRTGMELVRVTGNHLRLSPAVAVDVDDVERIARLVTDPSSSLASLNLDHISFAGDLLPGWDDEWVLLERERHRQILLHVLDSLCRRWAVEGRFADAIRAGLAAVASEPLRETSQQALISAFLAEGNRTEAVRQFEIYRKALKAELGLAPSAATSDLLGIAR